MAKIATVSIKGSSGAEYDFDVYPIDTNWKPNIAAVYVVTRRYEDAGKYYHDKIYIGRSDNLKERHSNHHKQSCFDLHDANCICIKLEGRQEDRIAIEADLLDKHDTPCND